MPLIINVLDPSDEEKALLISLLDQANKTVFLNHQTTFKLNGRREIKLSHSLLLDNTNQESSYFVIANKPLDKGRNGTIFPIEKRLNIKKQNLTIEDVIPAKVVKKINANSIEKKKKIEKEARLTKRNPKLNAHNLIWSTGNFDTMDGWLVMNHIVMDNLSDILANRSDAIIHLNTLTEEDKKQLTFALIEAVYEQITALGLVHNDLNHHNIKVKRKNDGRFEVVILDYGRAHALSDSSLSAAVNPLYGAPEQLARMPTDERTDSFYLSQLLREIWENEDNKAISKMMIEIRFMIHLMSHNMKERRLSPKQALDWIRTWSHNETQLFKRQRLLLVIIHATEKYEDGKKGQLFHHAKMPYLNFIKQYYTDSKEQLLHYLILLIAQHTSPISSLREDSFIVHILKIADKVDKQYPTEERVLPFIQHTLKLTDKDMQIIIDTGNRNTEDKPHFFSIRPAQAARNNLLSTIKTYRNQAQASHLSKPN